MIIPLLLLSAAGQAASGAALREAWRAPGASSETVLVSDAQGTSLLSLVNDGSLRSLVRVDGISGRVLWRTDAVPGVGWGSFVVREDAIILEGLRVDGSAGPVGESVAAVLSLATGERRWVRAVDPGSRLEFGENGGFVIVGGCAARALDDAGLTVLDVSGVRGSGGMCVATPRMLGMVRGRAVVLVPEADGDWRIDALDHGGAGWSDPLGRLAAPPEIDWRTGVMWTRTAEGLALERHDFLNGQIAWRSVKDVGTCPVTVRGVDGVSGAPNLLIQSCDGLTLLDPHNGRTLWTSAEGYGLAVLEGERFDLPELLQPAPTAQAVRWMDPAGPATGRATLPADSYGVPVAEGLLVRGPASVSLVDRADRVVWSTPVTNPRWALLGDLVVVAPELGGTRRVLKVSTGEEVGRFEDGEAVGAETVPGTASTRLLFVQGEALVAYRVIVR